MSDKIDMVISVALPPVASLSAPMLVAKKVCIICSFDITDKPSVHILAIHTSGSGLSVECSGIGRGKADGIFYCIDIFRGEAEAVIL